jgi:hypothetical protein
MQIGWYTALFDEYFTSGGGINATLDTDVNDAAANNTNIPCTNLIQLYTVYYSNPAISFTYTRTPPSL